MAEETIEPHGPLDETTLSHDDASALGYVLHHVKGSSPSSVTLLQLEEMGSVLDRKSVV